MGLIVPKISKSLSDVGINIISGLAIGIDTYSHIGCLEGKGKPWQ